MRPFEYLEPRSLEEAQAMLSEHKEEAKIIAGGFFIRLPFLLVELFPSGVVSP